MKHKLLIARVLLGASMCLAATGCGEAETVTDASGITVNEDMSVASHIVDDFDESVYSQSELQDMIVQESADYCSEYGAGTVSAAVPVVTDGTVSVDMTFASAEDYSQFNLRRLDILTLEQAVADGKVNISLQSIKDGTAADVSAIENKDGMYLLITDETGYVTLPGKVLYISDGVETVNKKQVLVTDEMDGLAYIVFSNK